MVPIANLERLELELGLAHPRLATFRSAYRPVHGQVDTHMEEVELAHFACTSTSVTIHGIETNDHISVAGFVRSWQFHSPLVVLDKAYHTLCTGSLDEVLVVL